MFLRAHNLIDYSLLLVIESSREKSYIAANDRGRVSTASNLSSSVIELEQIDEMQQIYHFGIIDYL